MVAIVGADRTLKKDLAIPQLGGVDSQLLMGVRKIRRAITFPDSFDLEGGRTYKASDLTTVQCSSDQWVARVAMREYFFPRVAIEANFHSPTFVDREWISKAKPVGPAHRSLVADRHLPDEAWIIPA